MRDFEELIPPVESKGPDGFEMISHPEPLKKMWKVANEFPAIADGDANKAARQRWYSRFREVMRVQGSFRKNTRRNAELWERMRLAVDSLSRLG